MTRRPTGTWEVSRRLPLELQPRVPVRTLLAGTALTAAGSLATVFLTPVIGPDRHDVVLAVAAFAAGWLVRQQTTRMTPAAARPWRWLTAASVLLGTALLVTGGGLTVGSGRPGIGDLLAVGAGLCAMTSCSLLARPSAGTPLRSLLLDGALVMAAVLVLGDTLVVAPLLDAGSDSHRLVPLVTAHGGYAAVTLGLAATLLVVAPAAMRRSASLLLGTVALQSGWSLTLVLGIDRPHLLGDTVGDLALLASFVTAVLAAAAAPFRIAEDGEEDRETSAGAVLVTLVALVALPVTLTVTVLRGADLTGASMLGLAVALALLTARTAGQIGNSRRLRRDLVASEEDFRELIESSYDGVAILDPAMRPLFASQAARTLLGVAADAGWTGPLTDLVHPDDRAAVEEQLGTDAPALHFRVPQADGGVRELEATLSRRPHSSRRVLQLRDVTRRRLRERELEQMAYTDHLTQLPNRALLFREMAGDEHGERHLLVADLDGFKAVNDVAGHEAGDHLLVDVARRLGGVVRDGDLVARLGGDEFAVLVHGDLAEAVEVAQRVVGALSQPHSSGEWTFAVGASVGVAALHHHGGQLAFREADAALRVAKQAGKGCLRVWAGDGGTSAAGDADLAAALRTGQVQLRFDPTWTSDRTAGFVASALPAWVLPDGAVLRDAELWAAADRQGHARELGRWVLRQVVAQLRELPVGVRLVAQLTCGHTHADDLAGDVLRVLAEHDVSPSRLLLRMSEQTLVTAPASTGAALARLDESGIRLIVDDHGHGQSLFALRDRAPLRGVAVDLADLARRGGLVHAIQVLQSVTTTAEALGIRTVARNVDTEELLECARTCGADHLAGRLFPHDLTADELATVVEARLGLSTP